MECILPVRSDTGEELVTLYGVPMGSGTSSTTSRYTSMLEHAQAVSTTHTLKPFLKYVSCRVHHITYVKCISRLLQKNGHL